MVGHERNPSAGSLDVRADRDGSREAGEEDRAAPVRSRVYFIRAGEYGAVKIGVAADPQGRLAKLQTGSPETLHLIREMDGSHPLERWLHARFSHLAIRGEWFRFDIAMLTVEPPPEIVVARNALKRQSGFFPPEYYHARQNEAVYADLAEDFIAQARELRDAGDWEGACRCLSEAREPLLVARDWHAKAMRADPFFARMARLAPPAIDEEEAPLAPLPRARR